MPVLTTGAFHLVYKAVFSEWPGALPTLFVDALVNSHLFLYSKKRLYKVPIKKIIINMPGPMSIYRLSGRLIIKNSSVKGRPRKKTAYRI